MRFRIGYGYDVHQLIEGEDFILGGIQIKHTKGAVVIRMQMCLFMLFAMLF